MFARSNCARSTATSSSSASALAVLRFAIDEKPADNPPRLKIFDRLRFFAPTFVRDNFAGGRQPSVTMQSLHDLSPTIREKDCKCYFGLSRGSSAAIHCEASKLLTKNLATALFGSASALLFQSCSSLPCAVSQVTAVSNAS